METFLQLLVSGVAMGFIYGLVALGLTLIWNTTAMITFAHDKVIMLSAYMFGLTFMAVTGVVASTVATVVIIGVFGILIGTIIFIPLRHKEHMTSIMATIMLAKVIGEIVRLHYGATALPLPGFLRGQIHIGPATTASVYVYIIVVGILLAVGVQVFISFTKAGKAMTCVSVNTTAAALMGINVKKYMRIASAISFILGAVIGILLIPLFDLSLNMATMIGLKGFAAAVVGGFGSLPGSLAGGVFIGIVENFGAYALNPGYKDAIGFILLIVFLMIKPAGLSGFFRRDTERVKPDKATRKRGKAA
ncbi:MAG: branched-chain amino acid ABC transporter permease [Clostridiales Family XIII bacterium]|jgi:branched-chain amino acid transport system permease protein|nr:branched-chain amino acid ABC transporter permease [Clostridiales Family XIII bacterium]